MNAEQLLSLVADAAQQVGGECVGRIGPNTPLAHAAMLASQAQGWQDFAERLRGIAVGGEGL